MVVNDFSKQRMTNGEPLPEAHDHVGDRVVGSHEPGNDHCPPVF